MFLYTNFSINENEEKKLIINNQFIYCSILQNLYKNSALKNVLKYYWHYDWNYY